MSNYRKELRAAPKSAGPRPWPIWPMRKSDPGITSYHFQQILVSQSAIICHEILSTALFSTS